MMLVPFVAGALGLAFLAELFASEEESFGYGESTLPRIPQHLWESGGFGLRGEPQSWRHPLESYGVYDVYRHGGQGNMGLRSATSNWRHPMPRPWEVAPAAALDRYGMRTGAGGIRGVPTFQSYTPAQMAAIRRDEAAQGLRSVSIGPMG